MSTNTELLQRISRVENALLEGLRVIEQNLTQDCSPTTPVELARYFERIRADKELRFPHRKILDFLLGEYDFAKNDFREVHFSRLVKEARVGKNLARIYLTLLESNGYIERRSDGYRIFYKLRR